MKLFGLLVLAFGLVACGYNFPGNSGTLPGGVEKVYIPLFINQTAEPQLENTMTNMVSEVFSRNRNIVQVKSSQEADAVLQGVVSNYSSKAISYDQNDDIGEFRATMTVTMTLVSTETKLPLWEKEISWKKVYNAADDKSLQEDYEQDAIEEISRRLAEEILYQLLDDF